MTSSPNQTNRRVTKSMLMDICCYKLVVLTVQEAVVLCTTDTCVIEVNMGEGDLTGMEVRGGNHW